MKTIGSKGATPRRILYVEDHDDSREVLVLMLENAGYAVSTANSIADGLSLVNREHFDLYILDSKFEDGSGLDLCRQIRAYDPVTPIIFYSSLAFSSDIEAGLAAGAQQYLSKPMGIYMISQTIGELLTMTKNARLDVQSGISPKQENEVHNVDFIENLS